LLLAPLWIFGLVALYLAVTFVQVWHAAGQDGATPADAIVVLGAAQYDGEPSGALRGRLDHALALWQAGLAPTIVVTGGNQPGDRTTEGLTGFTYLRDRGVPEAAILIEVDAADSYEALSATEVIAADHDLDLAILVSDPYHNLRLRGIADEVGLEAVVSATEASVDLPALARETAAVGAGRLLGYRRLSAWS
jgi:uncharacterized SAM-binding protein YcdF (DUF218 family)